MSGFLHETSFAAAKTELQFFDSAPTQVQLLSGSWMQVRSSVGLSDGPLVFAIPANAELTLDLAKTWLYLKAKIVFDDGTPATTGGSAATKDNAAVPPDGVKVTFVANSLHSMFGSLELEFADRLITQNGNIYPYRAFIEKLLTVTPAAAKSQLCSALFYPDTSGVMEGNDVIFTTNDGVKSRYKHTEKSVEVEMCDTLHLDFNSQEKLLLNGVGVKLTLRRSDPTFCLISYQNTKKFKIILTEAVLYVRLAELSPSVLLDTEKTLIGDAVKYFFQRSEIKPFNVAKGQQYAIESNLFLGQQPNRVVMCMVETSAFLGNIEKNPFNFQHFSMQSCALNFNGKTVPLQPYTFEFDKHHFLQGYYSLFAQQGQLGHPDHASLIKRDDYSKGYCLVCWDLTPDCSSGQHLQMNRTGSSGLEIRFSKALDNPVTVLVYAVFDAWLSIDRNRDVMCSYE